MCDISCFPFTTAIWSSGSTTFISQQKMKTPGLVLIPEQDCGNETEDFEMVFHIYACVGTYLHVHYMLHCGHFCSSSYDGCTAIGCGRSVLMQGLYNCWQNCGAVHGVLPRPS